MTSFVRYVAVSLLCAMSCAWASPQTTPAPITLDIGVPAAGPDETTLTFTRVVTDSRCPSGVQCVWAGELGVELKLTRAGVETLIKVGTMSPTTSPVGTIQITKVKDCSGSVCGVDVLISRT